jgi:hypothetical protein
MKQPFWNRLRGTGPLLPVVGSVAFELSNSVAVDCKLTFGSDCTFDQLPRRGQADTLVFTLRKLE